MKGKANYSVGNSIVYTNLILIRRNAFILIHHLIQLRTREKFFPIILYRDVVTIDR